MALGISRRCIGALCLQQGPSFTLAGPSRLGGSNLSFAVRGYAVSAAKPKQKTKRITTSTIKAALKSTPSSKGPKKTTTKPAGSADAKTSSHRSSATAARETRKASSGGMAYKIPEKKEEALTEEEQMAQVEQIMNMSNVFPTADPWGQRVETLDVMIPYSTQLANRQDYPTWRAMFDQFLQNRHNDAKNFTSMLMLAHENAIPGVDLLESTRTQKYLTQWPWRLFTTTSVMKGSWTETLRQLALESYRQLNFALSRQDDQTIKELSTSVYQDHIMHLRKRQQSHFTYLWRFHKEVTPARVVSIRATEGYLATDEPKFGNRMMVHALIRLDTEQSLEIYDRQGNPVHTRPANAAELNFGKYPAERRRVTEYLVFEKRMWYDGPWVIREQLWEAARRNLAV
ncbi:hypothetical protein D9615_008301 [Tricholomella constricta]|uniref:Tim44-like domain-containing protein n=1 Tax=Tricholomella constricta TaxID=117010 RepID=A0A8H5HDN3_9AGAR|nr:hypothetical protein D9615_008301 [Tricholomella constricta]